VYNLRFLSLLFLLLRPSDAKHADDMERLWKPDAEELSRTTFFPYEVPWRVNCDVYQRYRISRRITIPGTISQRLLYEEQQHRGGSRCRSLFDVETKRAQAETVGMSWQSVYMPWISRKRDDVLPIVCGMDALSTTTDRILRPLSTVILCNGKPVRSSSQVS
jgi:hypothetical protein